MSVHDYMASKALGSWVFCLLVLSAAIGQFGSSVYWEPDLRCASVCNTMFFPSLSPSICLLAIPLGLIVVPGDSDLETCRSHIERLQEVRRVCREKDCQEKVGECVNVRKQRKKKDNQCRALRLGFPTHYIAHFAGHTCKSKCSRDSDVTAHKKKGTHNLSFPSPQLPTPQFLIKYPMQ